MEAIGASSAVIALASTAYKSCQTAHNAAGAYRGAHERIDSLLSELESCQVTQSLGALHVE